MLLALFALACSDFVYRRAQMRPNPAYLAARLSRTIPSKGLTIAGRRWADQIQNCRHASLARHPQPRELPKLQRKWPLYASAAAIACVAWATFLALVCVHTLRQSPYSLQVQSMNFERASSSVVRTLISRLKASAKVAEQLGSNVHPVPFFIGQWCNAILVFSLGSVQLAHSACRIGPMGLGKRERSARQC